MKHVASPQRPYNEHTGAATDHAGFSRYRYRWDRKCVRRPLFRPCRAFVCRGTITQGGGNARQTRVALPWADLFGSFGAIRPRVPTVRTIELASTGNAVKDFQTRKTVANASSRSRETSGLPPKRPNSHESGYEDPERRCPTGPEQISPGQRDAAQPLSAAPGLKEDVNGSPARQRCAAF